jgi:protein gp37
VAESSKIEWTDHTFNPWTGCTKVSPGCDHCYAESWAKRSGIVKWGNHARKRTTEDYWKGPRVWNKNADRFEAIHGHRQRVFCASLADVFDNKAKAGWRSDLFDLIRQTPRLDWLLLTKRPSNISKMLPSDWRDGYPNVWLGMTAEDQTRFDQRWQFLSVVPATIRFISYEPAIGPLSIQNERIKPDWLIVGGESGYRARAMESSWARSVIGECRDHGIKPFMKQWGVYSNNPLVREGGLSEEEARSVDPHGKGGGLLDGTMIREFPSLPFRSERTAQVA